MYTSQTTVHGFNLHELVAAMLRAKVERMPTRRVHEMHHYKWANTEQVAKTWEAAVERTLVACVTVRSVVPVGLVAIVDVSFANLKPHLETVLNQPLVVESVGPKGQRTLRDCFITSDGDSWTEANEYDIAWSALRSIPALATWRP